MICAYIRVSHEDQVRSGLGLDAQRAVIAAAAAQRGMIVDHVYEDAGLSAKNLNRPGLQAALYAVESSGGLLIVSHLDRLSRSVLDFAGLMERSRKRGWKLMALDLGIDMTTPAGEMMANVLAAFAQFERRLISQRVTRALAQKRARGEPHGRPAPHAVAAFIQTKRDEGYSLRAIAGQLNRENVATAHGAAAWRASSVDSVLRRAS